MADIPLWLVTMRVAALEPIRSHRGAVIPGVLADQIVGELVCDRLRDRTTSNARPTRISTHSPLDLAGARPRAASPPSTTTRSVPTNRPDEAEREGVT